LPLDPVAAADVIARGRTRLIDVGRVNDRYFMNAAGIGFSNEVRDELDTRMKKVFGVLAYAVAVARRWRRHQPFTVEISGDLPQRRKVIQATVANGKFYGGGMAAHHAATIDDGRLVLLLLEAQPLWRHVLHVTNLKTGVYDFDAPFVVGYASALKVRTRRRKRVATDGEVGTHTPAAFEVLPKALNVLVP
jgi:YegS/Rv2252/BmrU family lipid kinase